MQLMVQAKLKLLVLTICWKVTSQMLFKVCPQPGVTSAHLIAGSIGVTAVLHLACPLPARFDPKTTFEVIHGEPRIDTVVADHRVS